MRIQLLCAALPVLAAIGLATGCNTSQEPAAAFSTATEAWAQDDQLVFAGQVVALDVPLRTFVLRDASGTEIEFHAQDSVRGFDQTRLGERLEVDYRTDVTVAVEPPGGDQPGAYIKAVRHVPHPGQGPEANTIDMVTVIAPIVSVDPSVHSVTVRDPAGRQWVIRLSDPHERVALASVKPGDLLRLQFIDGEAVAIRRL